MPSVELLAIYVLIWAAVALYVDALRLDFLSPAGAYEPRARREWAWGAALAVAHMLLGMHVVHHWSLDHLYAETAARTTQALAVWGIENGGGDGRNSVHTALLFFVVWSLDAAARSLAPQAWRRRPWWLAAAVHGYLAFIVFNATIVFGSLPMQIVGALACVVLFAAWRRGLARPVEPALAPAA